MSAWKTRSTGSWSERRVEPLFRNAMQGGDAVGGSGAPSFDLDSEGHAINSEYQPGGIDEAVSGVGLRAESRRRKDEWQKSFLYSWLGLKFGFQ